MLLHKQLVVLLLITSNLITFITSISIELHHGRVLQGVPSYKKFNVPCACRCKYNCYMDTRCLAFTYSKNENQDTFKCSLVEDFLFFENFSVPMENSAYGVKKNDSKNCVDVQYDQPDSTGIRRVYPYECCPDKAADVYCDQDENGIGWTVIQRRQNLTIRENFIRPWDDYVAGFGDLAGEFWAGLELIHALTTVGSAQKLRVNLEDYEGEKRFAEYASFKIGDAGSKYILNVGGYSGTAGDSLTGHNLQKFSTNDQDNDQHSANCAELFKGGWWYSACHSSNLNGFQYEGTHSSYADGINWSNWKGYNYSLKTVVMKIKNAV